MWLSSVGLCPVFSVLCENFVRCALAGTPEERSREMKVIIYRKDSKEFVEKILKTKGNNGYNLITTKYTRDFGKAKIFGELPLVSNGAWWREHAKLIIEK